MSQTPPNAPADRRARRSQQALLDALVQGFKKPSEAEEEDIPKFAIVGKPNVGKSSFVNALLGADISVRVIQEDGGSRIDVRSASRQPGEPARFESGIWSSQVTPGTSCA